MTTDKDFAYTVHDASTPVEQLPPLLSSAWRWHITTSLPPRVTLDHFLSVTEHWRETPEIICSGVLRAEPHLVDQPVPEDIDTAWQCTAQSHRVLLPRKVQYHQPFYQRVERYTCTAADRLCHAICFWNTQADGVSALESIKDFPYYIPAVPDFVIQHDAFMYVFEQEEDVARISIALLPHKEAEETSLPLHAHNAYVHQLYLLQKHMTGRANGYEKRVNHDQIVPKAHFQDKYIALKARHEHWLMQWSEKTDPKKYVVEDISIAAYLISLWENEARTTGKGKQRFVDIGCGNGLLTHILTAEGYTGFGMDIAKRKIWDAFGPNTDLREEAVDVKTASFPDCDWIISNHGDELTPWAPIIAHRSGRHTKWFAIPCCAHTLTGKYTSKQHGMGRYESYCAHLMSLYDKLAWQVEKDVLRIPSTRNVAIIGRSRTFDVEDEAEWTTQSEAMRDLIEHINVTVRKSDRELGKLLEQKRNESRARRGLPPDPRYRYNRPGYSKQEDVIVEDVLQ